MTELELRSVPFSNHVVDLRTTPNPNSTAESIQDFSPYRNSTISVEGWVQNLPDHSDYDSFPDPPVTTTLSRERGKRRMLGELDINIMDPKRRKSPRKGAQASAMSIPLRPSTPESSEVADKIDEDATPKSNKDLSTRPNILGGLPPDLSHRPKSPTRSSASSSSQRSHKSKSSRSASPSKRIRDLQLANHPLEWTSFDSPEFPIPESMVSLVDEIADIADGDQVISKEVAELAERHSFAHRIKDHNIERVTEPRGDGLSDEDFWERLVEILLATWECRDEQVSEASWNDEVHSRLLYLALRGHWKSEGIWYRNVTSARIDDRLFLESMESRIVDYCITLGNSAPFKRRIKEYLRDANLSSINHTSAPDLSFTPIAVSIETKRGRIDEDDAMHQLATWAAAQFALLRRLVRPETTLPPLLLMMVQGHEWNLMIATSTGIPGEAGVIFRDIQMGETSTIVGICKVIKSLRRIAGHVNNVYQPWFEKEVLG